MRDCKVLKWVRAIKHGRKNVHDEPWSSRPSVITQDLVTAKTKRPVKIGKSISTINHWNFQMLVEPLCKKLFLKIYDFGNLSSDNLSFIVAYDNATQTIQTHSHPKFDHNFWMGTDWTPSVKSRTGSKLFSLILLLNRVSWWQTLHHRQRVERSSWRLVILTAHRRHISMRHTKACRN